MLQCPLQRRNAHPLAVFLCKQGRNSINWEIITRNLVDLLFEVSIVSTMTAKYQQYRSVCRDLTSSIITLVDNKTFSNSQRQI